MSGDRRLATQFCALHLCLCRLIVGAAGVCTLQVRFDWLRRQRLKWSFLRQQKLLSGWQANDASKAQRCLSQLVAGNDQLLLASLQLDLRTQRVNGRCQTRSLLIDSLLIQRLSAGDLSRSGLDAGG